MTETPDAETVPRETGQEKATRTCQNCGAEVGVVETEYGGVSAANCSKCYPEADDNARQQAAAELDRETGTDLSAQAQTGAASTAASTTYQSGAFGLPNAEESA